VPDDVERNYRNYRNLARVLATAFTLLGAPTPTTPPHDPQGNHGVADQSEHVAGHPDHEAGGGALGTTQIGADAMEDVAITVTWPDRDTPLPLSIPPRPIGQASRGGRPGTWTLRLIEPDEVARAARVDGWLHSPRGTISPFAWTSVDSLREKMAEAVIPHRLPERAAYLFELHRFPLLGFTVSARRPTEHDESLLRTIADGLNGIPDEQFNEWYQAVQERLQRAHQSHGEPMTRTPVRSYAQEPPMPLLLWDIPEWRAHCGGRG